MALGLTRQHLLELEASGWTPDNLDRQARELTERYKASGIEWHKEMAAELWRIAQMIRNTKRSSGDRRKPRARTPNMVEGQCELWNT